MKNSVVLTVLLVVGLGLLGSLVYPFASALLLAAVLAGALHPWQERLTGRLGGRRGLAAGILTLAVVLLLVVPIGLLIFNLSGQLVEAMTYLGETLEKGGVPGLVKELPPSLRSLATRMLAHLPQRPAQITEMAGNHGGQAAMAVSGVVFATSSALIQVTMMVIAVFFLLGDGPVLVAWVARVAPLPDGQVLEILTDFRSVSVAVLSSSFATAGAQALAALVGFLLAGAPQPLFFTLVTFVMAFVPALGAASVVLATAVMLFFTGHSGAAAFLVLWGILVVGLIDNLVKPLLMKGRVEIHGALIFFALLGGLATFGPVGLVAGPLILSFFLTIVRIAGRDREAWRATG
jgi:predicted PurR-regulated permease PerM